jgi:hypothetical protein
MKIADWITIGALAGITLLAQTDEEFSLSMKSTAKAMDAMKKGESKTGEQVARHAERIGGVYENMIGFWRQRNAPDAVKWSEEGKAIALQLATAATANDTEKATEALGALGKTCKPCHDAHRERISEGKYRIK